MIGVADMQIMRYCRSRRGSRKEQEQRVMKYFLPAAGFFGGNSTGTVYLLSHIQSMQAGRWP